MPFITGRHATEVRNTPEVLVGNSGQSFFGIATLGSGQAAVDVAVPALNTPDLIMFGILVGSISAIASNTGMVAVTSQTFNPGSGVITFGTNTAVANKCDITIHWMTIKRGAQ